MRYNIQWHWRGKMHYLSTDDYETAVIVSESLTAQGYPAEVWQGATKVRG